MKKIAVAYATRSDFKKQEIRAMETSCLFRDEHGDDKILGSRFEFVFSDVQTDEPLEVDLATMVRHKAVSAYRALLVPCIVEHAGLILEAHLSEGYPGGLTQPMMDKLGPSEFVRRMTAADEVAIARAVIGYCDGMSVEVFTGETPGKIVGTPRVGRDFYWDSIFAPEGYGGETYAELSARAGVEEKMKVSQSQKAVREFAEFRVRRGANVLFTDFGP